MDDTHYLSLRALGLLISLVALNITSKYFFNKSKNSQDNGCTVTGTEDDYIMYNRQKRVNKVAIRSQLGLCNNFD